MPQAMRSPLHRRFDHGEPIRAIDIRPMLFVALIAALVFLLAASQTRQHALLVALPQTDYGYNGTVLLPLANRVELTASGQLLFNGTAVDEAQLQSMLVGASKLQPRPEIVFEPDANAPYDAALRGLGAIWRAGLVDEIFCFGGLEKHRDFARSDAASESSPPTEYAMLDGCASALFIQAP